MGTGGQIAPDEPEEKPAHDEGRPNHQPPDPWTADRGPRVGEGDNGCQRKAPDLAKTKNMRTAVTIAAMRLALRHVVRSVTPSATNIAIRMYPQ